MTEEKKGMLPHNIVMESRKSLSVSGINDVDSFDEQTIVAYTNMGELTIKGFGIHINKLSIETGDLFVEGEIYSLSYSDNEKSKGKSLFSQLFK